MRVMSKAPPFKNLIVRHVPAVEPCDAGLVRMCHARSFSLVAKMKYHRPVKILLSIVCLLGLSSFGLAETTDEAAVRAAHEAFVKAARAGDATALNKILADGLQYSHSSTKLENKQEAVAAMVKAPSNFEVHSQTIHVYGGKTATIRAKVTSHGANGDIPLTMLMVWVKSGHDWQLVERHTTRIPAAQ